MTRSPLLPALALLVLLSALVLATAPAPAGGGLPNTFQPGTPARAAEVNANFTALAGGLDALEAELAALSPPPGVVTVAPSGAAFDSVAAAVASLATATANAPGLVRVAPGVYEESQRVVVPPFVRVRGAGAGTTVIRGAFSDSFNTSAAAVVQLGADAVLEELTVENTGAAAISTGVFIGGAGETTLLRAVEVVVVGAGGTGHLAVSHQNGAAVVEDSRLRAAGASIVNSAFASRDDGGPVSQPVLRRCTLAGEGPTTGIALQILDTAAEVEQCRLAGDFRAVSASIAGTSRIRDSVVETAGLSPVYETTGSAAILSAGVGFAGGDPFGVGSSFRYVHCYDAGFEAVADGLGSSVE